MSEERHLTYGTIIDPVLYDWQKYLIELLQSFNYDVIYKMHPKGIFQEDNNLGQISAYKSTKHIMESFKDADIVVVDYAGSAFVEALCAGKDVIYIDMSLFLTDNYFNKLKNKNLFSNEKIIEYKNFVFENINKFFNYNLNQKALLNNIDNKIND